MIPPKQNRNTTNRLPHSKLSARISDSLEGHRILILTNEWEGEEGICLGRIAGTNRWAVSPDSSAVILELHFETEFALLLNPAT